MVLIFANVVFGAQDNETGSTVDAKKECKQAPPSSPVTIHLVIPVAPGTSKDATPPDTNYNK